MMNPMQIFQDVKKFQQDMEAKNPGMDPQKMVHDMVQSGKISQAQFEQARNMASMIGFKM